VDLDLELELAFSGKLWHWRGPSPFHFITVPAEACDEIRSIANLVSYGWGMIPVTVRIGGSEFTTALWPKDGRYIVPVKDVVRKAQGLAVGDTVEVQLVVRH
jgi:Domain of unknown function (DUF1905)